jgi:hypothetical protein
MMDFPSAARATPLLCVWGSARSPQGVRLIGEPRRDNVKPGGCQKAGMAYRADIEQVLNEKKPFILH